MERFDDFKFDLEEQQILVETMVFLAKRDIQKDERRRRWKKKSKELGEFIMRFPDKHRDKLNLIDAKTPPQSLRSVKSRQTALLMLIELALFSPYTSRLLRMDKKVRSDTLKEIGSFMGIEPQKVVKIQEEIREAARYMLPKKWLKIAATAGVGALALYLTGGFAAPAIGGLFGEAAGLSGAAAVSYGLAWLGGGALAAGGAGMAGGTALITTLFASAGGLLAGGGAFLTERGKKAALAESIKLNTTFAVIVKDEQKDTRRAQEMIRALKNRVRKMEKTIQEIESRPMDRKKKKEVKVARSIKKILERTVGYQEKMMAQ